MLDSPLIDKFYSNAKQIKNKFTNRQGAYRGHTNSITMFASYLKNIIKSSKNKSYINSLINYVYSQNLDIMFLYELAVAANNGNDKNASIQIALIKWHTRHNIKKISIDESLASTTTIEDLSDVS